MTTGMASDSKFTSHLFSFDAAWSPINHFGVKTQLITKGYSNRLERLRYYDFGLVYYKKIGDQNQLELNGGYGNGYVTGGAERYSSGSHTDYQTITITPTYRKFYSDTAFDKWYLTSAFVITNTENPLEIALGLEAQYIDFNKYVYINHEDWVYNNPFDFVALNPFINSRYGQGPFKIRTSFGYAFPINVPESPGIQHPVYNRLMVNFGLSLVLGEE